MLPSSYSSDHVIQYVGHIRGCSCRHLCRSSDYLPPYINDHIITRELNAALPAQQRIFLSQYRGGLKRSWSPVDFHHAWLSSVSTLRSDLTIYFHLFISTRHAFLIGGEALLMWCSGIIWASWHRLTLSSQAPGRALHTQWLKKMNMYDWIFMFTTAGCSYGRRLER